MFPQCASLKNQSFIPFELMGCFKRTSCIQISRRPILDLAVLSENFLTQQPFASSQHKHTRLFYSISSEISSFFLIFE